MALAIQDHFADPILDDLPSREIDIDNRGNSSELTDYQVTVDVSNYIDKQGIRFVDENLQIIDYWEEDSNAIWAEIPNITGSKVSAVRLMHGYIYSKNDGSIRSTMLDGDDFSGSSLDSTIWSKQYCDAAVSGGILTLDNFVSTGGRYAGGIIGKRLVGTPVITEIRINNVYANDAGQFGLSNNIIFTTDDFNGILYNYNNTDCGWQYNEGSLSRTEFDAFVNNIYYRYKIVHDGTKVYYYRDGTEKTGSPVSTNVPDEQMYMIISGDALYPSTLKVDWIFVRKYTSPEPTAVIA